MVARDWGEGMSDYKEVALDDSLGCWNCSISCDSYKNPGILWYGIYKNIESQDCIPETT